MRFLSKGFGMLTSQWTRLPFQICFLDPCCGYRLLFKRGKLVSKRKQRPIWKRAWRPCQLSSPLSPFGTLSSQFCWCRESRFRFRGHFAQNISLGSVVSSLLDHVEQIQSKGRASGTSNETRSWQGVSGTTHFRWFHSLNFKSNSRLTLFEPGLG